MIWNDRTLRYYCEIEQLVTPFDPACINPASLDLRLGTSYRQPDMLWQLNGTRVLIGDPAHLASLPTWAEEKHMPAGGILLAPGEFILCCSLETVKLPVEVCGILYSKSSTGRRGLEHMHAGYVDPGFCGQLTFEFHNVAPWPIKLEPGMRVMQLCIDHMIEPAESDYSQTGRYQNQVGATPERQAR